MPQKQLLEGTPACTRPPVPVPEPAVQLPKYTGIRSRDDLGEAADTRGPSCACMCACERGGGEGRGGPAGWWSGKRRAEEEGRGVRERGFKVLGF